MWYSKRFKVGLKGGKTSLATKDIKIEDHIGVSWDRISSEFGVEGGFPVCDVGGALELLVLTSFHILDIDIPALNHLVVAKLEHSRRFLVFQRILNLFSSFVISFPLNSHPVVESTRLSPFFLDSGLQNLDRVLTNDYIEATMGIMVILSVKIFFTHRISLLNCLSNLLLDHRMIIQSDYNPEQETKGIKHINL